MVVNLQRGVESDSLGKVEGRAKQSVARPGGDEQEDDRKCELDQAV